MKKAEEAKDEAKIAELNRMKVDYEQTVRLPRTRANNVLCSTSLLTLLRSVFRFWALWTSATGVFELHNVDWRAHPKRTTAQRTSYV